MKKIALKETSSTVKKLITDEAVETLLGSMVTTQGTLVLLFSPRFNKDFFLLVSSQEMPEVLARVYDVLAQNVKDEML